MLSPSEIQSLFHGLDLTRNAIGLGESDDSSLNPSAVSDQFTLPLTLAPDERAALLNWQATFGERWKQTWPEPLRQTYSLISASIEAARLRDFVSTHAARHCFQAQAVNAGGVFWMAFDERFVAAHLDCLLGAGEADGASSVPHSWGPVEHRLTCRLVQSAGDLLFSVAGQRSEWNIEAVNSPADWIAGAPVFLSCELVQFEFEINSPGSTGRLTIGIPRTLCAPWSEMRLSPKPSADQTADDRPSEPITLRAILTPLTLSQAEFAELRVGDVLLTGQEEQSACLVSLNGEPQFQATIGGHQGHKAIRLIAEK